MKMTYTVSWDALDSAVRYSQDFENIDEARIALALHHSRNAELKIVTKQQ